MKLITQYLACQYVFGENTILVPTFWGQSIWSLYFCSNQFSLCYFQPEVNLIPTINSLTENAYVTNGLHSWHTLCLHGY